MDDGTRLQNRKSELDSKLERNLFEPVPLRQNTTANYIGTLAQALLGFLFVPVYIRYLGVESYGLVGFSVSFQAMLRLTDLGVTATLSREFARGSVATGSTFGMRNLLMTLQTAYWGISVLAGGLVFAAAPLLARHWIDAGSLGVTTVRKAVLLMGLSAVLQGPKGLYTGGIFGLQRHILGNGLNVALTLLRSGGVVLALAFIAPTIVTFFAFQFVVTLIGAAAAGMILWNMIPRDRSPARFQTSHLRSVWRFAAGMSLNSALWMILSQMDKIILIKVLPLKSFGFYAVAGTAAAAITYLSAPLYTTFLPRFTQLFAVEDHDRLKETYRLSGRLNALLVVPAVILLAIFSRQALLVWTGDPLIAANAHVILSLLAIGCGLNQLGILPFALQVASGWVKPSVYMNTAAVILIGPALFLASRAWGGIGAAAVWIALNATSLGIQAKMVHGRVLKGEAGFFFMRLLLPLVFSGGVGLMGRIFMPDFDGLFMVVYVGLLWVTAAALIVFSTPEIKKRIPLPCARR